MDDLGIEKGKVAVPALMRGVAVLDLVAQSAAPLSLSEISRQLNLAKSTTHGVCETLCHFDLLRLEGRGYMLGAHPMVWAQAFQSRSGPVSEFHHLIALDPVLRDYTVSFSVLDHHHVTYLASHASGKPLGMSFAPGSRLPAVFTATGKIMLAQLPPEARAALIPPIWPTLLTPCSVASAQAFDAQIPRWRALGYAIDAEEVRTGMICLAVIVPDAQGGPAVAGLALSMTCQEAQAVDLDLLASSLRAVAARLAPICRGLG